LVTPACGWDVDDVVRWLEDSDGMFDALTGVTRDSEFDAWFTFDDTEDPGRLGQALQTDAVPTSMRTALEEATIDGNRIRLKFTPVDPVELTERGPDHLAACVLERRERSS